MSLSRHPFKWIARGIVALLQWTNRKWSDPTDRLRNFIIMGWSIGFVEAFICATLGSGLLVGIWIALGGTSDTALIVFVTTLFPLLLAFSVAGMVGIRSCLPLSIWMERRVCRQLEIEQRHDLDYQFFEATGSLVGTRMGVKVDVSRLELARIAFTVQFFLWALDPIVQREWQARAMQLASDTPRAISTKSRL